MPWGHRDRGRRWGGGVVRGLIACIALLCAAPACPASVASTDEFPVPPQLVPAVRFWVDVFTRYSRNDFVIHDRLELGRIYAVVHAPRDPGEVADWARRVADRLVLEGLWGGDPFARLVRPEIEACAAALGPERVRVQRGMREVFAAGLLGARRYRRIVERALAEEGVPRALAALPLVESSYNTEATSSAGAVGIWQLTAETAQRFLRVSEQVDERRDPVRATRAAARLLRALREALPNWPLALTAYNHGLAGVERARRAVGSDDLGVLVVRYAGPGFGFASRNFYAEFVAALQVSRHVERYFPEIAPDRIIEYQVKRGDSLFKVARRHGITVPKLCATNGLRSAKLRPGQVLLIHL